MATDVYHPNLVLYVQTFYARSIKKKIKKSVYKQYLLIIKIVLQY